VIERDLPGRTQVVACDLIMLHQADAGEYLRKEDELM
jgi:hypothetical protein